MKAFLAFSFRYRTADSTFIAQMLIFLHMMMKLQISEGLMGMTNFQGQKGG